MVSPAALDPVWGTMRGVSGAGGAATDHGPAGIEGRADLARSTLAGGRGRRPGRPLRHRRHHAPVVSAYGDGPLGPHLAAAALDAHCAYADTAAWLRTVYAPRAVEADGVGPERHALARRAVLGADADPVESYEWAWTELHRIEDELAAEAERVSPGAGLAAVTALLDETDVIDGPEAYRAWLQVTVPRPVLRHPQVCTTRFGSRRMAVSPVLFQT